MVKTKTDETEAGATHSERGLKQARSGRFSEENEGGPGRTRAPRHEKDQANDPGRVVRFIITPADFSELDRVGGQSALSDLLTEQVERFGLHAVLQRLGVAA